MHGAGMMRSLSRGATFFLRHALELLSEGRRSAPGSFQDHATRLSGILKLLGSGPLELSDPERGELARTIRTARILARMARLDPRWQALGITGDPSRDLADLEAWVAGDGTGASALTRAMNGACQVHP